MEGQIEPANCAKRPFIILPILLTLFTTTLKATNENPTTPSKDLTFSAVPIIANTVETYRNLKTIQATHTEERAIASINTPTEATIAVAPTEIKDEKIALEAPVVAHEEKLSSGTEAALTKMASTSFSFSELAREERRQYIAYFAESYTDWGFNYRFGGTSIEKGIDCSGFTRYVLNYFDIKAPRTSGEQYDVGDKIPVEQARAGDLVFFGGKKSITHVALVVSNDEKGLVVVHSCNRGILKENISQSSYWRSKLRSMAVNIFDASQNK